MVEQQAKRVRLPLDFGRGAKWLCNRMLIWNEEGHLPKAGNTTCLIQTGFATAETVKKDLAGLRSAKECLITFHWKGLHGIMIFIFPCNRKDRKLMK